jgi:hypothetical protein
MGRGHFESSSTNRRDHGNQLIDRQWSRDDEREMLFLIGDALLGCDLRKQDIEAGLFRRRKQVCRILGIKEFDGWNHCRENFGWMVVGVGLGGGFEHRSQLDQGLLDDKADIAIGDTVAFGELAGCSRLFG